MIFELLVLDLILELVLSLMVNLDSLMKVLDYLVMMYLMLIVMLIVLVIDLGLHLDLGLLVECLLECEREHHTKVWIFHLDLWSCAVAINHSWVAANQVNLVLMILLFGIGYAGMGIYRLNLHMVARIRIIMCCAGGALCGAATNSSNSELQAMSLADQPRAPISHTLTLKLLLKMFADFVPTAARVSLAETPAFAKAVNGALANVAVGVSRLRAYLLKLAYLISKMTSKLQVDLQDDLGAFHGILALLSSKPITGKSLRTTWHTSIAPNGHWRLLRLKLEGHQTKDSKGIVPAIHFGNRVVLTF
uniref:Uncharacterized protein n=1 Tax=Chenopodium quinoa TaxID=63459 RepID=A0A803LFA3_CHEQI